VASGQSNKFTWAVRKVWILSFRKKDGLSRVREHRPNHWVWWENWGHLGNYYWSSGLLLVCGRL